MRAEEHGPGALRRRLWGTRRYATPVVLAALFLGIDAALRSERWIDRLGYLATRSSGLEVTGLYALSFGAAALFFATLLALPRIGTVLCVALVTIGWAGQLAYHRVMNGYASDRELRNVLHADGGTSLAALTSFFEPVMLGGAVLAIGLGGITLALARHRPVPRGVAPALGLLLVTVLYHGLLWDQVYRRCHDYPVDPVLHTVRSLFYFEKEEREFQQIARDRLEPLETGEPPRSNVVLILDESVRFGFVTSGPDPDPVTPHLQRLAREHPGFRDYGLMLAASTCSMSSEAMLLTGTQQAPDHARRALRNPTVFDHARRHGYRTALVDAWGTTFPNNVIRRRDLAAVDLHLEGRDGAGPTGWPDVDAAIQVRELLEEETGWFVFVLKRGAHFHYENSYPNGDPRWRRFTPTLGAHEGYGASAERMRNSYRNAVGFSVDGFLAELDLRDLPPTTLLYASDHGQSLQETGQTYTHCRHEIEQALVPFFSLSNDPWVLDRQPAGDRTEEIVFSHHNIYPTVVSLLARQAELRHGDFASLLTPRPEQPPLRYLAGGLFAGSRMIPVRIDELERFRVPHHALPAVAADRE